MKQKCSLPKPRNPVAAFAKRSGSGIHKKSKKAERRAQKIEMKKNILQ